MLFTVAGGTAASAEPSDEEMRLWQLALTAYRLQHWQESPARLQGLKAIFAGSTFSDMHRRFGARIDHYRGTPPPPDWDGAHIFDSK